MRVGLDAHMVGAKETGNETYVRGLVAGFEDLHPPDLDLVAYYAGSPWTAPKPPLRFSRLMTPNPAVRLGAELPLRSAGEHLDVLHMTYTAPVWSAAPIVLTVHDVCYKTNPEWFSSRDLRVLSMMVPRSIHKAAHVITDSQDARSQIIKHYGVADAKITSIPIGAGPGAQPITTEAARQELVPLDLDFDRPYVLTVGNLQPRKNLLRLVEAFGTLASHDVQLVIVGPRRYRAEEVVQAAGPLAGRVHFTGYVTDRQLAACYRCSTVFVLPSLYEGFGLPVLEAMAHGVAVACSKAGSLPEVAGDAAVMFDPTSVTDIARALDRLLGDPALRQRLGEAGKQQAARFSWQKTAAETLRVYERVRRSRPT